MQSYYTITDHMFYAVCYIPVSYLFYNWRFISLYPFHLFCTPTPTPGNLKSYFKKSSEQRIYLIICPAERFFSMDTGRVNLSIQAMEVTLQLKQQ